MSWQKCNIMDQRLKFIARLLDGQKMTHLCKEFGISRKTGYKIYNRYKDCGLEGFSDRSRRPYRHANQLPFQVERSIIQLKKEFPNFGAPKIREKLIRQFDLKHIPAKSMIHAVLDRNGLVSRNKRNKKWHKYKAKGTNLSDPNTSNSLWCADYKVEFLLGNKKYCYPLTITDYHSRYLLACESLESTKEAFVLQHLKELLKNLGCQKLLELTMEFLFLQLMLYLVLANYQYGGLDWALILKE